MLVAAAFVPTAPLLVPEIAGGSAAADEELRTACRTAVARLLASNVDELVVVGAAPTSGPALGGWDWRGFGVPVPTQAPEQRLARPLAIGGWLLEQAGGHPSPPSFHGIAPGATPEDCAALGAQLVTGDRRVGLLVCGDGSACRTEKAPGFLDPAARAWDTAVVTALQTADPAALLALDVEMGTRVLAEGRAAWQVLAGAADSGRFASVVDWADAPYGVMYVAGTWTRKDVASR